MSFSIESKAAPSQVESGVPALNKAAEARAKAIAMLTNSAPQGQGQEVPSEVRQTQTLEGQHDQTVETSSSEPAAETPPAKKEEPISSQYAVLARKEKQLRVKAQQQELAFKQREDAIRSREAEYARKDSEYQTNYVSKDRLKSDLFGTLAEQGMTYDEITQLALSQPQVDPGVNRLIQELKSEIKALRGDNESTKKSIADSQAQSYQQAVRQIETDAKDLVRADERFETIRSMGQVGEVVELIKKTFEQDGILLSVEEAAQAVEDELVEEAMKITRISKIQQRLKSATAPTPQPPVGSPKQSPGMKTLTNAVGTSRQLSARERAILAMEGKLNK